MEPLPPVRPRPRPRRRWRLALGLAALTALAAASCSTAAGPPVPAAGPQAAGDPAGETTDPTTVATSDPGGPTPDAPEATPPASTATTEGEPAGGGAPPQSRQAIDGLDECRAAARGPWESRPSGPDPLAALRSGELPAFIPSGPDRTPLDQLTEMPTVGDYRDPSTLEDPDLVLEAFDAAGYEEGVDLRYEEGNYLTVITMVRFRDAAGAASALSAHLADYCSRVERGYVRTGVDGLVLLRESETVRTLFVLGEVEVSVLVCGCYVEGDDDRMSSTERWSEEITGALTAPDPVPAPTPV